MFQPLCHWLDDFVSGDSRSGQTTHRKLLRKAADHASQLTIHADRGSAMTSKSLAVWLADLGAVKTHSRPQRLRRQRVFGSALQTMKYRPEYPDRFGSIQNAPFLSGLFSPGIPTPSLGAATADPGHRPLRSGRPAQLETAGRSAAHPILLSVPPEKLQCTFATSCLAKCCMFSSDSNSSATSNVQRKATAQAMVEWLSIQRSVDLVTR